MINKLKNLKLITIIAIMSTLSLIFTCVIGSVGYFKMKNINNNLSTMYQNNLTPVTSLSAISTNFVNIQLLISKAQVQYDCMDDTNISTFNEAINKELNKLSLNNLDREVCNQTNLLKSKYSQYMKLWNNSKITLSTGAKLQEDDIKQFEILGTSINSSLQGLIKYEVTAGYNLKSVSDNIYSQSVLLFLLVVTTALIVLIFICYGIIKIIGNSSKEMIDALEAVSQGDFTTKLTASGNNEFSIMKKSLNETIDNVSAMLNAIKNSFYTINERSNSLSNISEEMACSSEQVSSTIQNISESTSSQADDMAKITNSLNEFSNQLTNIVTTIEEIKSNNTNIHVQALESNADMETVITSVEDVTTNFEDLTFKINDVGNKITEITKITSLINNISEQTNLLSLNAAIEAARAGEAGKGFSIVAEEIRKLSEQSKNSLENITLLINNIFKDTKLMVETTSLVNNELAKQKSNITTAITSFNLIKNAVDEITPKIEDANLSILALNNSKEYIMKKISLTSSIAETISSSSMEISASSEEMTASSQEVASTAQGLNSMTNSILSQVNQFRLSESI